MLTIYTNSEITHYTKAEYIKRNFDVYSEQNSTGKSTKEGDRRSHALFVSVPTDKKLDFSVGDFIIIGKISVDIDKASEKSESESLKGLRKEYQLFTISSVTPCLYGSKATWHYELECD